jgi:hypothetical protein
MRNLDKLDKQIKGVAGVGYVAAKLSEYGWSVATTTRNAKAADILAFRKNRTIQVQVKTAKPYKELKWAMSPSDAKSPKNDLFYVFVKLKKTDKEMPDFYIVPSSVVARTVSRIHKEKHEKKGNKPTTRRVFTLKNMNNWKKWKILEKSTFRKELQPN